MPKGRGFLEGNLVRPEPSDYAVRVGSRLRAVRQLTGLSLAAVEARSGGRWDTAVIGAWERASRPASVEHLAEYAAFLGIPVRALLPDCPEGDADLARFAADTTARRVREITGGILTEQLAS
jgi:transcriptional regulator with XRE-family HTH domain